MPRTDLQQLAGRAERLRALHTGPDPLVLPNAWDAASAVAVERAGARAVATTSSGVAATLGYEDGEAIPADEMLAMIRGIASAVEVPVTADLEAGYGLPPGKLLERMLDAGAVGLNLEDTERGSGRSALAAPARQAARIAELRAAADATGVPIVINARIDTFLRSAADPEERLADALARGRAYLGAGADCVYPITLDDANAIGRFVREVGGPVNILLRPGSPSIASLRELGVRRISVGGGLWRHAMVATEVIARRLVEGDDAPFGEIGET